MESNVNLLFLALNTGCCLGFLVRLPIVRVSMRSGSYRGNGDLSNCLLWSLCHSCIPPVAHPIRVRKSHALNRRTVPFIK